MQYIIVRIVLSCPRTTKLFTVATSTSTDPLTRDHSRLIYMPECSDDWWIAANSSPRPKNYLQKQLFPHQILLTEISTETIFRICGIFRNE